MPSIFEGMSEMAQDLLEIKRKTKVYKISFVIFLISMAITIYFCAIETLFSNWSASSFSIVIPGLNLLFDHWLYKRFYQSLTDFDSHQIAPKKLVYIIIGILLISGIFFALDYALIATGTLVFGAFAVLVLNNKSHYCIRTEGIYQLPSGTLIIDSSKITNIRFEENIMRIDTEKYLNDHLIKKELIKWPDWDKVVSLNELPRGRAVGVSTA